MQETPLKWLSKREALDRSGLPFSQLRRLARAKLLRTTGGGRGLRFAAADLDACCHLWDRLDAMLPPPETKDESDDD